MNRLLRIEFIKVRTYRAFWATLGIYALLFITITIAIHMMETSVKSTASSFFSFPDVWHNLAYVAAYLNLLPAILIIMLVSNEYTFKTFRQNLIDGLSREELVYLKFISIGGISVLCIAFIFTYGLLRGLMAGHFDELIEIIEKIPCLFHLFIQMAGYMSVAALIAFILKRAAVSIMVFLVYVGFEFIARQFGLLGEIRKFFPVSIFASLVPEPGTLGMLTAASLSPALLLALATAYIAACFSACYVLMNRSNL